MTEIILVHEIGSNGDSYYYLAANLEEAKTKFQHDLMQVKHASEDDSTEWIYRETKDNYERYSSEEGLFSIWVGYFPMKMNETILQCDFDGLLAFYDD